MTVETLLDSISSHELTEWMAYAQLEPFGEERADIRSATNTMVLANANRDPKKKRTPYTIEDFMLFRDDAEKPEQTQAETAEKVARMMGAPM